MLSVQFFSFNPLQENSYVVYNQQSDAIIIDPGCYGKKEEDALFAFVAQNKLNVVQLINTHCHLDHVFGNKAVAAAYGLELFIHRNEEQLLAFAPVSGKGYGLPFENYEGPLHFLSAGDKIRLGSDELIVLLTPGHSPGSICLYSASDGFVIGGDVLFRESIGRTDLPGGNHAALIDSIQNELFTLPDDVVVYPGHGPLTTIAHEKKHNPYLQ